MNNKSAGQSGKLSTNDTQKRPLFVSKRANLICFGSAQEPRMVWAEYIGPFQKNEKVYSHIYMVKYYYTNPSKTDTVFYENLEIRNKLINPDWEIYKIADHQIDEGTILITNGKDTIDLFSVLQTEKYNEEYKGTKFTNIPSVREVENGSLIATSFVEYNLKIENNKQYVLTLRNGTKIHYRLCAECKVDPEEISFMNREDGRIYFIERNCYLELTDGDDVVFLKREN